MATVSRAGYRVVEGGDDADAGAQLAETKEGQPWGEAVLERGSQKAGQEEGAIESQGIVKKVLDQ